MAAYHVRMRCTALFVLCASVLLDAIAFAQEWPQFRGPDGQGHSDERQVPVEWSATRNVVWKVPVPGRGWSSPIVASGRVWLTTATSGRDGALRLLAFDVESGRQVLNAEVFRIGSASLLNEKNSHASPTSIADAERVYVHFGAEGTAALTMDGKVVWKTRLPHQTQHGNGGSPVIYRDLLIVNCDGADTAFVVALDKSTGKVRWKTSRRQPWSQAYTTPLVIRHGEQDQLVSVGASYAAAYEPQTGREIWYVGYPGGFSNVPRPVASHDLVYITTGFHQPSLLAIRPDGKGDVTRSHVAWAVRRAVPFTPSPLIVGDELYMVSDAGIATSVDAKSGEILWQHRLNGAFSASPVFADGRIYFQSEEGITTVVAPGRTLRILSVNALDGPTLASMAVASGSVFLRTATHLYRIGANQNVK
jgi:outer membrane protein assembly factor BamB